MSLATHFEPDIAARVHRDFGADADSVFRQLLELTRLHPDVAEPRIIRCILHAAGGRPEGLALYLRMAATDYRDVIMNGEYQIRPGTKPRDGIVDRIHDFNRPFTE